MPKGLSVKYIVLVILSFHTFFGVSQTESLSIEEWMRVNEFNSEDYLYFITIPKQISKLEESTVQQLILDEKALAKKQLKNKISPKLNDSRIADFLNLEKYYVEQDKKTFRVVCLINKTEVSDIWIRDLDRQWNNLLSSVREEQVADRSKSSIEKLLYDTKKKRDELELYEEVTFSLNPQMRSSSFDLVKTDINLRINKWSGLLNESVAKEKIMSAQALINSEDYIGAYKAFKFLKIEYPNNSDVISGLDFCLRSIIDVYDSKILQYEMSERFDEGIKTIQALLALDLEGLREKYTLKLKDFREREFKVCFATIKKLIEYKTINAGQVKLYLNKLRELKDIDSQAYDQLKIEVDKKLLEVDFRLVRSDIYNKNYSSALARIPAMKMEYERSKVIESFENKIDKKIYRSMKRDFLTTRPRLFNFEPSIFVSSPLLPMTDLNFSNIETASMLYCAGLYRRFKIKPKSKAGSYKYSTIGLKFDYLNSEHTFKLTDSTLNNQSNSFFNPQVSLGLRKFFFLDLGVLNFSNNMDKYYFNSSISTFIPMGYFSLGITTKYFTDFKSTNSLFFSTGLKFNFGFCKKFNKEDKRELETNIFKLKQ